jgi:hypothetical protein
MKTPRELLMARHRSIEPRLNAIRQQVLNNPAGVETKIGESGMPTTRGLFATWGEALRPFRFNLAGLGFACLLIVAFRVATPQTSNPVVAKTAAPSADLLAALQEKRRLYAELTEQSPAHTAEPPKPIAPKPHSERREIWSSV